MKRVQVALALSVMPSLFVVPACLSSDNVTPPTETHFDASTFDAPTVDATQSGNDAAADAFASDTTTDQSAGDVAVADSSDAGVADSSDAGAADSSDSGVADSSDAGAEAGVPTPPPSYLWYVLDETTGTTAHDSSSHHFDITNLTGVTWNQGANFNGTGGCGSTTLDSSYRQTPITLSAWLTPAMRSDAPTSYALTPFPPNALSDDIPGIGGFGLGLNVWSNGSALAAEGVDTCHQAGLCVANSTLNAADAGLSCTSNASCQMGFTAANEYFVVVSIGPVGDGGANPPAKVYVNGALFDDTLGYPPAANASPPLYLGCHNNDTGYGTARFFDGRIRDVRVYQRALGAAEVGQLYANGPTLHAPPPSDAGIPDASAD